MTVLRKRNILLRSRSQIAVSYVKYLLSVNYMLNIRNNDDYGQCPLEVFFTNFPVAFSLYSLGFSNYFTTSVTSRCDCFSKLSYEA